MNKLYFKIFLFVILLNLTKIVSSQTWDYSYTHYGKEDGFPSNTVYCMTADKDGIMWAGTDAGLVRFDGSHFKVFTTENGLPSNDVFNLFCDSKNRIWIIGMSLDISYIKNDKIHNKLNDSLIAKMKIGKYRLFNTIENEKTKKLYVLYTNFVINEIDQTDKLKIINLEKKNSEL